MAVKNLEKLVVYIKPDHLNQIDELVVKLNISRGEVMRRMFDNGALQWLGNVLTKD